MEFVLAASLLDPIVHALELIITSINGVTHNFGWSLIALAALVKLAFWPLSHMQFKSMAEMQALQPHMKALRERFKGDPQKLNAETMALYKEHGVNPLAGCFPLLLQMPILFSLYWAIISNKEKFAGESWAWIGSGIAHQFPNFFAPNLAAPDYILLGLYVVSMYFSVKYGSPPSSDPQQAQTQQVMAFLSPVMIAFFGRTWPSALILYWLTFNVFNTAQQFYLMNKFKHALAAKALAAPKDVTPKGAAPLAAQPANGSTSRRKAKRRARR